MIRNGNVDGVVTTGGKPASGSCGGKWRYELLSIERFGRSESDFQLLQRHDLRPRARVVGIGNISLAFIYMKPLSSSRAIALSRASVSPHRFPSAIRRNG